MNRKALVLSSGGVDSTTCVSIAVGVLGKENVSTVSALYGQKHSKEIECAKKVAEYYGVPHYIINLANTGIYDLSDCSLLTGSSREIKHESYVDQMKEDNDGIVDSYVPFRNGLLLSAVAAMALSIYPEDEVDVYLGAHADDAATAAYADCSEAFNEAMAQAINLGTYGKVTLRSPLILFNKAQVVRLGAGIGTPYHLTWSCYEGGEVPCRECGTCRDREVAFETNGMTDPLILQQEDK